MKRLLLALVMMLTPAIAEAGNTYYYKRGRYAGRSTTINGYTRYYSSRGRYTGSSRDSITGRTFYYNSRGRYQGYTSRHSRIPNYGRK